MSDTPRPGEIELDSSDPPVVDDPSPAGDPSSAVSDPPAPDPVADPVEEPVTDPHADPPAAPKRAAPSGMLAELIEERRLRKDAEGQLRSLNPVLSRLTPEVQQALVDGRLVVTPAKANGEAERERLAQVATDLGLFTADSKPDIDAAGRVDRYVRGTVKAAIEPVRNMTLADKARANVSMAVSHATQHMGADAAAVVQEEFEAVMAQPNGPQMLSQAALAKTVWRQAMGRLVEEGKLAGKAAPAAPKPPVVPADATGRRGSTGAAIALSPAAQRVYSDHGVDPAKGFSSKANLSNPASIELE